LAPTLDLAEPPSTYTSRILLAAMDELGDRDPFVAVKREQNDLARPLAEAADRELGDGPGDLRRALALAAAGNVIDSGPRHEFPVEAALERLSFARDDSELLLERLVRGGSVLYILDNSGEVMFDRLVLERLAGNDVTIVARSSPVLNDVTVDEARALGLGEFGRVIGTGSRFLGVDLATVSDEFRQAYEAAGTVIAKGHANFESLAGRGRDGFYVLKAKCELVADVLGVGLGESACYYEEGRSMSNDECRMTNARSLPHSNPGTLESSNPIR
ncbi:DUF89 family protein, partial [candidate division WOR-3 bacterium]|nr:DUF89 family protein [candidate division WOR-3 bacterium]